MAADYLLALELFLDAEALTRATAEIESLLQRNPNEVGESRATHERTLICNPLTVTYEVFDEARIVLVVDVHYHLKPKRDP